MKTSHDNVERVWFCSTCGRFFKTPDHFRRWVNKRAGYPCVEPKRPSFKCKTCGKLYSNFAWAAKHAEECR